MACYACSRDPRNWKGPQSGCYKRHRGLTEAKKSKRDRCEEAQLEGWRIFELPGKRLASQADSAAANATDVVPGDAPRSRASSR
eukprot:7683599-Pyramimonas_sp.AAC.1